MVFKMMYDLFNVCASIYTHSSLLWLCMIYTMKKYFSLIRNSRHYIRKYCVHPHVCYILIRSRIYFSNMYCIDVYLWYITSRSIWLYGFGSVRVHKPIGKPRVFVNDIHLVDSRTYACAIYRELQCIQIHWKWN